MARRREARSKRHHEFKRTNRRCAAAGRAGGGKIHRNVAQLASTDRAAHRTAGGDSGVVAPLGSDVAVGDDYFLLPQVAGLELGKSAGNEARSSTGLVDRLAGYGPASVLEPGADSAGTSSWTQRMAYGSFHNDVWLRFVLYGRAAGAARMGNTARWSALYGMLFLLHFGLFDLLSCAWRSSGVDAQPIMNKPLSSRNIVDFWGRRWNLAFRDVAHAAVFRPLARSLGASSGGGGRISVQRLVARSGDLGSSPGRLRFANTLFLGPAHRSADQCFAAQESSGARPPLASQHSHHRNRGSALANSFSSPFFAKRNRSFYSRNLRKLRC